MACTKGKTKPRIFTKPLRELTPETSRGYECIKFAEEVLLLRLLRWQKWLLIHMLELNPDGTLRFRKALVIVGRQNGKTLVGAVLAAFWLYVDSARWPHVTYEDGFVVVGAAQKLDIALKPWWKVRRWGGPDDPKLVEPARERVPLLQANTYLPRMVNGEVELRCHNGAVYLPRTFEGARGHSAVRLLLDELRQQYDYEGWSAIEKAATAQHDSMLVAFSNAGTHRSVVLKGVRKTATRSVSNPNAQWFIAEWSAPPKAKLDDPKAFAQANPSAGYLPGMTIAGLMQTTAEAENKAVEQIEVLGQWVSAEVQPYIDPLDWQRLQVKPRDIVVSDGARTVWGIDTSHDRSTTWVSAAVFTGSGRPLVTTRTRRVGNIWAVDYLADLAKESGQYEVALQAQGCPVVELIGPLKKAGLIVHELDRPTCAIATGRVKDRVRDKHLVLTAQPDIDLAIAGGQATKYAENRLWSRERSSPVDIAGLCAETWALYALEVLAPPPKRKAPPLSRAAVLTGTGTRSSEGNLLQMQF